MEKRVFKKSFAAALISSLAPVIFTAVILGIVLVGLNQTEEANSAEGVRLLEEAIFRAVVHSYAVNGYYPESLSYLVETYGIHIDSTRYIVHYRVVAANLFPDIRVIELR